jgi:hypothetical protein
LIELIDIHITSRDRLAHWGLDLNPLGVERPLTERGGLFFTTSSPNTMSSTEEFQPSQVQAASSTLAYDLALLLFRGVTKVFFREVRPRGSFNIPRDGPVIFVGAPHSNQVRIIPLTSKDIVLIR